MSLGLLGLGKRGLAILALQVWGSEKRRLEWPMVSHQIQDRAATLPVFASCRKESLPMLHDGPCCLQ